MDGRIFARLGSDESQLTRLSQSNNTPLNSQTGASQRHSVDLVYSVYTLFQNAAPTSVGRLLRLCPAGAAVVA